MEITPTPGLAVSLRMGGENTINASHFWRWEKRIWRWTTPKNKIWDNSLKFVPNRTRDNISFIFIIYYLSQIIYCYYLSSSFRLHEALNYGRPRFWQLLWVSWSRRTTVGIAFGSRAYLWWCRGEPKDSWGISGISMTSSITSIWINTLRKNRLMIIIP